MDFRKRFLYVIFDKLAKDFGPIFEAPNDGVAMRQYNHLLKQVDESSLEDYKLFRLGTFEAIENGIVKLNSLASPEEVVEEFHE